MSKTFAKQWTASFVVALVFDLWGIHAARTFGDDPPPTASPKFDFASAADKYTVQIRGSSKACEPCQIDLLKWTNPIRGTLAGSVFLWTEKGLPQAACCMYAYRVDNGHAVDHELVSLSTEALEAQFDGQSVWRTEKPGITWLPASGAPPPAASRSARLIQMRKLATTFSGFIGTPTARKQELRLLPQPIYRFPDSADSDGGVFAFVETTDPEILLLLRADMHSKEPAWQFAAARMTIVHAFLAINVKPVWTCAWWTKNSDSTYITRARVPFSIQE